MGWKSRITLVRLRHRRQTRTIDIKSSQPEAHFLTQPQSTWISCTLNLRLFSTALRSYKRIQSIGGLTSSFSPGEFVSSSLTFCTSTPRCPFPPTRSRLSRLRQYPLYSKPAPPSVLAEHFKNDVFEKSQKYGKHKAKFSIVSGLYKQVIDTLQIASGIYYPWAWSASGQLLGLAGYGPEYLVCPRELIFWIIDF